MRTIRPARVAACAVTLGLFLSHLAPACAQSASPAGQGEGSTAAPSSAAIDKGVPPAKRPGDEGGKPSAAMSGAGAAPGSDPQPASPAQ